MIEVIFSIVDVFLYRFSLLLYIGYGFNKINCMMLLQLNNILK